MMSSSNANNNNNNSNNNNNNNKNNKRSIDEVVDDINSSKKQIPSFHFDFSSPSAQQLFEVVTGDGDDEDGDDDDDDSITSKLNAKKKKLKAISCNESVLQEYTSLLNQLQSLSTFPKLFQMTHKDNMDIIAEEYAYHTWKNDLQTAFNYHFDEEGEVDEELEERLQHVTPFVAVMTRKLEEYLTSKVAATATATTMAHPIKTYEQEANRAMQQYVNDKIIPLVLEYIASIKTSEAYGLIIPKEVKVLNHLDPKLTYKIRDLYCNGENGLICFSSSQSNDENIPSVPAFYEIDNLFASTSSKILSSNTNHHELEKISHPDIPDEIFYDLADGSCVALLNSNELLIFYEQHDLYHYNRRDQIVRKINVENDTRPKFATSDIVSRGDGDNFIALVASNDEGKTCDLWNFHYPSLTWTTIDKDIQLPVPDAVTMHQGELYIIIPSSNEEKPDSIFRKYNFERAEWSDVEVNGFSPLMERMRIQSLGEYIVAFGDFESSTLLFLYSPSAKGWKSVDLDPVAPSEEELFDTLIAKNMKNNKLILYYEYCAEGDKHRGYLQYVDLNTST